MSRTAKEIVYRLPSSGCVNTIGAADVVFALCKARRVVEVEWDDKDKKIVFKAVVPLPKSAQKLAGRGGAE